MSIKIEKNDDLEIILKKKYCIFLENCLHFLLSLIKKLTLKFYNS